jgi:hypothetical protein
MKTLLIVLLLAPVFVSGQKLQTSWGAQQVSFTSAKQRVYDKANKVIYDGFKDAFVTITPVTAGFNKLTVDAPDRFYVKDAYVINMKYEYDEQGESVSYTAKDGTKIITLLINYNLVSELPESIIIVATDDPKVQKKISVVLYDFK